MGEKKSADKRKTFQEQMQGVPEAVEAHAMRVLADQSQPPQAKAPCRHSQVPQGKRCPSCGLLKF